MLTALAARANDPNAIHAACVYTVALEDDSKYRPRLPGSTSRAPCSRGNHRRTLTSAACATCSNRGAVAALEIPATPTTRERSSRGRAGSCRHRRTPFYTYVKGKDEKTPARLRRSRREGARCTRSRQARQRDRGRARCRRCRTRAAMVKPIAADDDTSAYSPVARSWRDCSTIASARSLWFFDEVGELHAYDGYAVMPMVLGSQASLENRSVGATKRWSRSSEGAAMIDERVTFMDKKHTAVRHPRIVTRAGVRRPRAGHVGPHPTRRRDRAPVRLVHRGTRGGPRGSPPIRPRSARESTLVSKVPAHSAQHYSPIPAHVKNHESELGSRSSVAGLDVVRQADRGASNRRLPERRAAKKAVQALEGKILAAGGRIRALEVDKNTTRRETPGSTSSSKIATTRSRRRGTRACAPTCFRGTRRGRLRALVPDITVMQGPPASDADIAAYQAVCPEPLLPLEVWREVGQVAFKTASREGKFYGPTETRRQTRGAARGVSEVGRQEQEGPREQVILDAIDHLDTIITVDGEPATMFDAKQREDDDRCFSGPEYGWRERP